MLLRTIRSAFHDLVPRPAREGPRAAYSWSSLRSISDISAHRSADVRPKLTPLTPHAAKRLGRRPPTRRWIAKAVLAFEEEIGAESANAPRSRRLNDDGRRLSVGSQSPWRCPPKAGRGRGRHSSKDRRFRRAGADARSAIGKRAVEDGGRAAAGSRIGPGACQESRRCRWPHRKPEIRPSQAAASHSEAYGDYSRPFRA
jgi:hypothetical protein